MTNEPKLYPLIAAQRLHFFTVKYCPKKQVLNIGISLTIMDNIDFFKPTIILVVPMIVESMYYKLCEASKATTDVPKEMIAKSALGENLKTIYSGGAYLNPSLIGGFKEFGISLIQGYGMTECAPRISANFERLSKAESVGKLVTGCEAKIVDNEIWVKSSSVMLGYYNDEEETNKTLENGWLKTGDLGYIDEDNFLYITGRKKNLIILSNGENISPEELENGLYEYPIIKEAVVFGENNIIHAEIYPNYEYAKSNGIEDVEKEVKDKVDDLSIKLPLSKRISNIIIRDTEFEKTTSKKIKRRHNQK